MSKSPEIAKTIYIYSVDKVNVNRKKWRAGRDVVQRRLFSRRLKYKNTSWRLILLSDHMIGPNSIVCIIWIFDTTGLSADMLYK